MATHATAMDTLVCLSGPRVGGAGNEVLSEVHGGLLSAADRAAVTTFVGEFVGRGLLGFVERQMRLLNDTVASRSRLGKSLLSVTKNWLGRSPAPNTVHNSPSLPTAAPPTLHSYTPESGEMQTRRLADLAFLFHHYALAFPLYQSLKKDFAADGAWLHYAGALEMAALSAFLLGPHHTSRPYPAHYMDSALTCYAATCRRPLLAGRAALASALILHSLGLASDAASQAIRMTSADWDLWSGLFLEAASRAFVNARMVRKAALHSVLAGHRFSKAKHHFHALRCYESAAREYAGKEWGLAEDHIWYTVGHQAATLQRFPVAHAAFAALLHPHSKQAPSQQLLFLKEYLKECERCGRDSVLALPRLRAEKTLVFVGGLAEDWVEEEPGLGCRLESSCLRALGRPSDRPHLARPVLHRLSSYNHISPLAMPGEPFVVELALVNPLGIPLGLRSLSLEFLAENEAPVKAERLADVILGPLEERIQRLSLVPLHGSEGCSLDITGVRLSLSPVSIEEDETEPNQNAWAFDDLVVEGRVPLELWGRRMNGTKEQRQGVVYATDKRLQPRVAEAREPLVELQLERRSGGHGAEDGTLECLAGELLCFTLCAVNPEGPPLDHLLLAAAPLGSLSAFHESGAACPAADYPHGFHTGPDQLPEAARVFTLLQTPLAIGQSWQIWIQAPQGPPGYKNLDLVFVYAAASSKRHRVVKRGLRLETFPSVTVKARSWAGEDGLLGAVNVGNANTALDPHSLSLSLLSLAHTHHSSLRLQRLLSTQGVKTVLEAGEMENLCLSLGPGEGGAVVLGESASPLLPPAALPWPSPSTQPTIALSWKSDPVSTTRHTCEYLESLGSGGSKAADLSAFVSASLSTQSTCLSHDFTKQRLCRVGVVLRVWVSQSWSGGDVSAEVRCEGKGVLWSGLSRSSFPLSPTPTSLPLTAVLSAPGLYQLSSSLLLHASADSRPPTIIPVPPAFLTLTQPS